MGYAGAAGQPDSDLYRRRVVLGEGWGNAGPLGCQVDFSLLLRLGCFGSCTILRLHSPNSQGQTRGGPKVVILALISRLVF